MALTKYNYNSFNVTPVASKALAFNSGANGLTTATEGAMVLIKTLTASSSANLSFVNGTSDVVISSTYPIYLFKFINIHNQTSAKYLSFQVSTNTGSSYGVAINSTHFRAYHYENGTSATVEYSGGDDLANGTGIQHIGQDIGVNNDDSTSGELWLYNPSSTTFVKHFMARTSNCVSTPTAQDAYTAGYINSTSAVDAVQFSISSGNMDSGTIKLYGIKDS